MLIDSHCHLIYEGLVDRQAEALAQQPDAPKRSTERHERPQKDADTVALEKLLNDVTGLTVSIEHKGDGGEVRIRYRTLEQLDELCRRLKG